MIAYRKEKILLNLSLKYWIVVADIKKIVIDKRRNNEQYRKYLLRFHDQNT